MDTDQIDKQDKRPRYFKIACVNCGRFSDPTRPGNPQVHSMNLPRHAEIWLLPYLKDRLRKSMRSTKPKRAWVAITDHYEPLGKNESLATGLERVARWREKWPRIADDAPRDAAGQRPQYSFFYPQEGYRPELIEGIAEIGAPRRRRCRSAHPSR